MHGCRLPNPHDSSFAHDDGFVCDCGTIYRLNRYPPPPLSARWKRLRLRSLLNRARRSWFS
jgi:hypothetical protein